MAATGTPTPNIGLRIPVGTDPASVDDINYNSNLLDTKLGAVGSDSVQDQIDTLNSNIDKCVQTAGYNNETKVNTISLNWTQALGWHLVVVDKNGTQRQLVCV